MPPDPPRPDREIAGLIAAQLAEEHFGTGTLAELRRLDPARSPTSPAMLRLLIRHVPTDHPGTLQVWTLFIHCIATVTPQAGDRRPLGRALFEAGFTEGRFSRLLATRGEGMADAMPRTMRFLRAKGVAFAPADLWAFLHATMTPAPDAQRADAARTRLARAYYQAEDASIASKKGSAA